MTPRPSSQTSQDIMSAIEGALKEERVPSQKRLLRSFLLGTGCALVAMAPVVLLFFDRINVAFGLALGFWWLSLVAGFALYNYPQPRLAVRGFWAPWVISKVIIMMSIMTLLFILLCPSFVFVHGNVHGSWTEPLSLWLMYVGGMKLCMLGCGFLFSLPIALFSFFTVLKTVAGSSLRRMFQILSLAYVSQIPILLLQLQEEILRPYVLYWALGSFMGLMAVVFLLRLRR